MLKKIALSLIIAVLIAGLLPAAGFAADISEGDSVDGLNGWRVVDNSGLDQLLSATIVKDPLDAALPFSEARKVIMLNRADRLAEPYRYMDGIYNDFPEPVSGYVEVSMHLRNSDGYRAVADVVGESGDPLIRVLFNGGGNSTLHNGNWDPIASDAFPLDEWFLLSFQIDTFTRTWDVFVDGVKVNSASLPLASNDGTITSAKLNSDVFPNPIGSTPITWYWGGVEVKKFELPEINLSSPWVNTFTERFEGQTNNELIENYDSSWRWRVDGVHNNVEATIVIDPIETGAIFSEANNKVLKFERFDKYERKRGRKTVTNPVSGHTKLSFRLNGFESNGSALNVAFLAADSSSSEGLNIAQIHLVNGYTWETTGIGFDPNVWTKFDIIANTVTGEYNFYVDGIKTDRNNVKLNNSSGAHITNTPIGAIRLDLPEVYSSGEAGNAGAWYVDDMILSTVAVSAFSNVDNADVILFDDLSFEDYSVYGLKFTTAGGASTSGPVGGGQITSVSVNKAEDIASNVIVAAYNADGSLYSLSIASVLDTAPNGMLNIVLDNPVTLPATIGEIRVFVWGDDLESLVPISKLYVFDN